MEAEGSKSDPQLPKDNSLQLVKYARFHNEKW